MPTRMTGYNLDTTSTATPYRNVTHPAKGFSAYLSRSAAFYGIYFINNLCAARGVKEGRMPHETFQVLAAFEAVE